MANVRWEEETLVAELTRAEDGSTAVMRRSLIDPDTMKVTTGVGQAAMEQEFTIVERPPPPPPRTPPLPRRDHTVSAPAVGGTRHLGDLERAVAAGPADFGRHSLGSAAATDTPVDREGALKLLRTLTAALEDPAGEQAMSAYAAAIAGLQAIAQLPPLSAPSPVAAAVASPARWAATLDPAEVSSDPDRMSDPSTMPPPPSPLPPQNDLPRVQSAGEPGQSLAQPAAAAAAAPVEENVWVCCDHIVSKFPWPLSNRDMTTVVSTRRLAGIPGVCGPRELIITSAVDNPARPSMKLERQAVNHWVVLEQRGVDIFLTVAAIVDLGGDVPKSVINSRVGEMAGFFSALEDLAKDPTCAEKRAQVSDMSDEQLFTPWNYKKDSEKWPTGKAPGVDGGGIAGIEFARNGLETALSRTESVLMKDWSETKVIGSADSPITMERMRGHGFPGVVVPTALCMSRADCHACIASTVIQICVPLAPPLLICWCGQVDPVKCCGYVRGVEVSVLRALMIAPLTKVHLSQSQPTPILSYERIESYRLSLPVPTSASLLPCHRVLGLHPAVLSAAEP